MVSPKPTGFLYTLFHMVFALFALIKRIFTEMLALHGILWYTEFMNYDYPTLYNKNAEFYKTHKTALLAIRLSNVFLSWLFVVCYGVLWVNALWLNEFSSKEIVAILLPPALTLLTATLLRILFERPRPYSEQGANITPLVKKKDSDLRSFPSRHLACAAVISTVYLPFYPIAGISLLLGSLLLGYVRFALGLHYPSDLLAGEGIGVLFGCLTFFFV